MTPPAITADAISTGNSREAQVTKLQADLDQVRALYQVGRGIELLEMTLTWSSNLPDATKLPSVVKSAAAAQGQVRVLVETAELLAFTEVLAHNTANCRFSLRLHYTCNVDAWYLAWTS